MLTVKIQGLARTNRMLVNLGKNTDKEIELAGEEFMKFVQKSAKLRAPKDTHTLSDSITFKKATKGRNAKQMVLTVEAPWGAFVEYGVTPHWIHTDQIIGSNKLEQIFGNSPRFIFVSGEAQPFIRPALEAGLNQLPNMLQSHLSKAVSASGGK